MRKIRLSIRARIIGINALLAILFLALLYGHFIPSTEEKLVEKRRQSIQEVVRAAISLLDHLEKEHQSGGLTLQEAQRSGMELLRHLRYEEDNRNYLFVADLSGKMLVHPFAPQLEGKDTMGLTDPQGRYYVKEMITLARQQGFGYVDYAWAYYGDHDRVVPKIGYVQSFAPWGWVVGTGIYIDDIEAEISRLERAISAVVAVSFTIVTIAIILISNRIVRPIQQLRNATQVVATGDLQNHVQVKASDEILDLAHDFNALIDSMRDVLSTITRHSMELATSTEEMSATLSTFSSQAQAQSASTEEIAAAAEELSAGMDNLMQSTVNQTESVQSLIQTVRGLSESIHGMAGQVVEAQQETDKITGLAREGEDSLHRLNESMQQVLQSSNSVTGIVQIINEISDRINLLSLNAAIEAARAGDSGRGFAVVAEEVGKLAERTSSSIREISELVEVNNQQLRDGIEQLQSTTRFITDILTGIGSMSGRMNNLKDTMTDQNQENEAVQARLHDVSTRSDEIKGVIEEHKNTVAEIAQSVSSINDSIQSIVSAAEEMTANSEQISAMADSMREKTTFFKL